MSYPTEPVYIHTGGWDDETRSHPALKFMEHFTVDILDGRKWDSEPSSFYCSDFILQKSDGTVIKGAEEGWAAVQQIYGPFTAQTHEPNYLMANETADGWHAIGEARLFVNLPGSPSPGEQKVKDGKGKEWDAVIPSAFEFHYVKDESAEMGMKLALTKIFGDPLPALGPLLKRGVLKPEDLLK